MASRAGCSRSLVPVRSPPWPPWLLRIVANEARNRRRSAARRARAEARAADESRLAVAVASTEGAVVLAERDGALRDALARLEPRDREALYLRYFLDLAE